MVIGLVGHYSGARMIAWQNQVSELQSTLQKRSDRMKGLASEFLKIPCGSFEVFEAYPSEFKQAAEKEEIALFKYDDETLLFWSDNTLPVGLEVLRTEPNKKFGILKNGGDLP